MSNDDANNALTITAIDKTRYIKADKSGRPVNKQVPRTIQTYSGAGGVTIDYDGSNDLLIRAGDLLFNLIVRFGPALQNIRNLKGRALTVHLYGATTRTVTLNTSPVLMNIDGTGLMQLSHVVPGDLKSKTISMYFVENDVIQVDYGASAASVVPYVMPVVTNVGLGAGIFRDSTFPSTLNFKSIIVGGLLSATPNANDITIRSTAFQPRPVTIHLPYGSGGILAVPLGHNPSGASGILEYDDPNRWTDGLIGASTSTTFGGTDPVAVVQFDPCPRKSESIVIPLILLAPTVPIERGFSLLTILYDAINVREKEFVVCANGSGTMGMYDPPVFAGSPLVARDYYNADINTGMYNNCIAANIKDNYYFLAESGNTTVFIKSLSVNSFGGGYGTYGLFDLATSTDWELGARISDMDFDETRSVLYVLQDTLPAKLLAIPIAPYEIFNTGVVEAGPTTPVLIGLANTDVPQCIAVDQKTGAIYISYSDVIGNRYIAEFAGLSEMTAPILTYFTGYNAGRFSMVVGSYYGRLYVHNDFDKQIAAVSWGKSLKDGLTVLNSLPVAYSSMSRNLYNMHYE